MTEQLSASPADEIDEGPRLYTVDETSAGERLDAFLAGQTVGWSRSRLQRLISDAEVLVNGVESKPSYKLRAGDTVELELVPIELENFAPEQIPLDIVFEDDHIAVVDKPSGMVVHPATGAQSGTLANALAFHFNQLSDAAGRIRPGIVHRLDRDTSGLMVVAKTNSAHEKLSDQFRAREVFKSYKALVHGRLKENSGKVDAAIARDPKNRARMAVVAAGRPSLSIYRLDTQYSRFALVDVQIKTGRTHQIRVHMAYIKHPVVGDKTYGEGRDNAISSPKLRSALRVLNRQFLHAAQLGFKHPQTGEFLKFKSPLSTDLGLFLDAVKAEEPVSEPERTE